MSTWVKQEYKFSIIERFFASVLKCGKIPEHLAIIMDGNRRYAKQKQIEKIKGHSEGFSSLTDTLQWCRYLGIHTVTVYAFSIENFKRDKEEVENLLHLFREKIRLLISEEEKLRHHGIRVKIIGNLKMLPEDVQDLCNRAMDISEENSKFTLNVAFSYTSREEITHAVRESVKLVQKGEITPEQIDEQLLDDLMYTSGSPKVDLLLRTSGECRLSDFMLWQASESITYFTKVLWPEFRFYHLLLAVFFYQRNFYLLDRLTNKERIE
eukprot:TRINITY_DN322_c0_g1_i3.p1 TRINITY_DN322_c0_g1~~TRINITY_DN322_c0_g1_i3.p1  ORF type:complete len:267 (-),score=16.78 TRINITY_DN322_c0_g1_i3:198-998(-)